MATGFHVYATNDEPTTAEVNGYVGEQIIARDTYANLTAISSPPTGLHGWATDKKILIYYNGSAWVNANVPVFTKANLPTGVPTSTVVYCSDAAGLVRFDGSAWQPLGVTTCTNATRPSAAHVNQVIFETDTFRRYYCSNATGPTWTAAGGSVYIGSAPGTAVAGDVWVDTTNDIVYFCSNATGPVWTSVNARTWTTGGRPASPITGESGWNSTLTQFEVYNGSGWVTVGSATQIMASSGASGFGGTGATQYIGPGDFNNTEANVNGVMAVACTVSAMYVVLSAAPGSTKSWTFTLRKNGSDTAITCTISDPATTGNDTAHTVTFAAGDTWSIKGAPSTTVTSAAINVALKAVS